MDIEENIAIYGSLDVGKEWVAPPIEIPTPILCVGIYGCIGAFVQAKAEMTVENSWKQCLDYNVHLEYMYNPIWPIPISNAQISSYNLENLGQESQGMISGSFSAGLLGEIGIEILNRKFAALAVRGEAGLALSGNYVLGAEEANQAETSPALYDELKNYSLNLTAFLNFKALARAFKLEGSIRIPPISRTWDLYYKTLVPTFKNTYITRPFYDLPTLHAEVLMERRNTFAKDPGFLLYEDDNTTPKLIEPTKYEIQQYGNMIVEYSPTSPLKKYTIFPTINLFGIKILASPYATVEGLPMTGLWRITIGGDYILLIQLDEGGTGKNWQGDQYDNLRWTFDGEKLHMGIDFYVCFTADEEFLGCEDFTNYYVLDGIFNDDLGTFSGTCTWYTGVGWVDGHGTRGKQITEPFTMKYEAVDFPSNL
jgi:hypothetical protein